MSFFRSIRTSMARGKSTSSRDTTPVRPPPPASCGGAATMQRRDSIESRTDSLLNRSDTFILGASDNDHEVTPDDASHSSNTSTLEKKSKKSKVLSKFSTFTKRSKKGAGTRAPVAVAEGGEMAYEHHPSDNATNTYYKWQNEGLSNLAEYDAQADPFNFLYEQPSSLKAFHQNGNASPSAPAAVYDGSATYRKASKSSSTSPSTPLKEHWDQMKSHPRMGGKLLEELPGEVEPHEEADKYKTITLNSFRKSFRDKFLQQHNEVPHNPSWFVQVEAPATRPPSQQAAKENRPDFLVFENDNYRPQSQSPVRERRPRSPVKRNETFRVERPSRTASPPHAHQAIRVEIKNSISPHMPGRIVPMGVAKPMPSSIAVPYNRTTTTTARDNWPPSQRVNGGGRFQTLVQIVGSNARPPVAVQPNRLTSTTRIQLNATDDTPPKRLNAIGSRYSLAAPQSYTEFKKPPPPLPTTPKPKTRTYFGDSQQRSAYASPTRPSYNSRRAPTTTPLAANKYSQQSRSPADGFVNRRSAQPNRGPPTMTSSSPMQRRSRSPIKVPWR